MPLTVSQFSAASAGIIKKGFWTVTADAIIERVDSEMSVARGVTNTILNECRDVGMGEQVRSTVRRHFILSQREHCSSPTAKMSLRGREVDFNHDRAGVSQVCG